MHRKQYPQGPIGHQSDLCVLTRHRTVRLVQFSAQIQMSVPGCRQLSSYPWELGERLDLQETPSLGKPFGPPVLAKRNLWNLHCGVWVPRANSTAPCTGKWRPSVKTDHVTGPASIQAHLTLKATLHGEAHPLCLPPTDTGPWVCALPCVKWTASGKLLCSTGNSAWCSGMT